MNNPAVHISNGLRWFEPDRFIILPERFIEPALISVYVAPAVISLGQLGIDRERESELFQGLRRLSRFGVGVSALDQFFGRDGTELNRLVEVGEGAIGIVLTKTKHTAV